MNTLQLYRAYFIVFYSMDGIMKKIRDETIKQLKNMNYFLNCICDRYIITIYLQLKNKNRRVKIKNILSFIIIIFFFVFSIYNYLINLASIATSA